MKIEMTKSTSQQVNGIGLILRQYAFFPNFFVGVKRPKQNVWNFKECIISDKNMLTNSHTKQYFLNSTMLSCQYNQHLIRMEWVQLFLLFCSGPDWPSWSLQASLYERLWSNQYFMCGRGYHATRCCSMVSTLKPHALLSIRSGWLVDLYEERRLICMHFYLSGNAIV